MKPAEKSGGATRRDFLRSALRWSALGGLGLAVGSLLTGRRRIPGLRSRGCRRRHYPSHHR